MADMRQFSEESLRRIQRDHTRLKTLADNIAVQQQQQQREGEIIRTVTGYTSTNAMFPTYPTASGHNTYVVKLRDYSFPATVGVQTRTSRGNATRSIIARTWDGSSIVENTPVVCDLIYAIGQGPQWWIRTIARPDFLFIRNDTGSAISAGDVLMISGIVSAPPVNGSIVFTGVARSGSEADPVFAIAIDDAASSAVARCVTAGAVVATVNVVDADNTHARIESGATQFKGDFGGWARILYKPTGTGVKTCIVSVAHNEQTVRKARATTTVTDNGTGSADVFINGTARGNVTVSYNWMTGAGNIANGSDLLIQYFHDEDKWVVIGAECPP
jgi:hypothetical protein